MKRILIVAMLVVLAACKVEKTSNEEVQVTTPSKDEAKAAADRAETGVKAASEEVGEQATEAGRAIKSGAEKVRESEAGQAVAAGAREIGRGIAVGAGAAAEAAGDKLKEVGRKAQDDNRVVHTTTVETTTVQTTTRTSTQ